MKGNKLQLLFTIFFLCFYGFESFAQSKKAQIEELLMRKDSLFKVLAIQSELKDSLNQSLAETISQIGVLSAETSQINDTLELMRVQNNRYETDISKDEQKNDSLRVIIEKSSWFVEQYELGKNLTSHNLKFYYCQYVGAVAYDGHGSYLFKLRGSDDLLWVSEGVEHDDNMNTPMISAQDVLEMDGIPLNLEYYEADTENLNPNGEYGVLVTGEFEFISDGTWFNYETGIIPEGESAGTYNLIVGFYPK